MTRANSFPTFTEPARDNRAGRPAMTFTDAYWRFYLTEHRLELLARTRVFEPANVDAIPSGLIPRASATRRPMP